MRFRPAVAPAFPTLVSQLTIHPDGMVLASTAFGLIAWKDSVARTLTPRDGLPCERLLGLVFDEGRNLWIMPSAA
jgi:hypothetical protein